MGMDVGGQKGVKSEINVVPLIDIVLVLLVIFMVIIPLAQKGLDINIPEKNVSAPPPPTDDENKPIVLSVRQDASIDINMEPVPRYQLSDKVKEIFANRKDKTIFIKAHGSLVYGSVIEIMDICRGSGIETLGIVTESRAD